MDLKTFWLGWRRDIIRFVVLCTVALFVGLAINAAVGRARQAHRDFAGLIPRGLTGLTSGLDDNDASDASGPRTVGETWAYRAKMTPGEWVWVRDRAGSVKVERARGDSLEVTAVKTFGHSDPASVQVVAVPGDRGITICALWGASTATCGPGEAFKDGRGGRRNDVQVQFTVRLPRGVAIEATTISGAVHVAGAAAPIVAATVNGDVDAETAKGPVDAVSVNGSVRAAIRGFGDTGAVKLQTVNGSVTAELPAQLDASVSANTVNGAIESDFPLTISGKFVARHGDGMIGAGGGKIELISVNGAIRLKKIAPAPAH